MAKPKPKKQSAKSKMRASVARQLFAARPKNSGGGGRPG